MSLSTFVIVSLAAYRAWRLIFVDDFPPIAGPRRRFTDFVQERWGDDWADGISCPFCSGTWVALAATTLYDAHATLPVGFLWYALAVAAVVGIIGGNDG